MQTNKCNLRAGLVFAFTQRFRRSWSLVMSMAAIYDLPELIFTYSRIPCTFILVSKEFLQIVPLKLHKRSSRAGAATLNLKKYSL